MSRPIKFRGQLKESKKFVYGFGVHKVQYTDESESYHLYTDNGVYEVDPETVGQYTGLTDRKGKQIYESDFVSVWNMLHETTEPYRAVVEWDKYRFALRAIGKSDFRLGIKPMLDLDPFGLNLEVIGSRYTHPHLMEVSNT